MLIILYGVEAWTLKLNKYQEMTRSFWTVTLSQNAQNIMDTTYNEPTSVEPH